MAQQGTLSAETWAALSHIQSLLEAFRAFDADNDGQITLAELGGLMASLGCPLKPQDLQEMGRNRGGLMGLEDFVKMNAEGIELGDLKECLISAVEALSSGGDETVVTAEELYGAMLESGEESLSLEDCKCILASMDADGDGVVDAEDLRIIVNSLL